MATDSKPLVGGDPNQQNKPARARKYVKRCGASLGGNKRCRNPVATGHRRCKRHGGSENGAPEGNQNARVHGFFSHTLSAEDLEDLKEISADLGNVDHEVMAARLRVRRVERAERRAAELPNSLEAVKTHTREAKEFGPGDEEVRERIDYGAHSDRAIKTALHAVQVREDLLVRRAERASSGIDDEPVTEYELHIVTAENVNQYREQAVGDE